MAVIVKPDRYRFVQFDSAEVARLVTELLDRLGMADRPAVVDIDETTPLTRAHVCSSRPIIIHVDSGAYEDPRVPRTLSADHVCNVTGRLLLRVRDRESGAFADAPPEGQIPLPTLVAWDVHSCGRLERLGFSSQRDRWLYIFRVRHGFTDAADAAFERLWRADELTWAELAAISAGAIAATGPA